MNRFLTALYRFREDIWGKPTSPSPFQKVDDLALRAQEDFFKKRYLEELRDCEYVGGPHAGLFKMHPSMNSWLVDKDHPEGYYRYVPQDGKYHWTLL